MSRENRKTDSAESRQHASAWWLGAHRATRLALILLILGVSWWTVDNWMHVLAITETPSAASGEPPVARAVAVPLAPVSARHEPGEWQVPDQDLHVSLSQTSWDHARQELGLPPSIAPPSVPISPPERETIALARRFGRKELLGDGVSWYRWETPGFYLSTFTKRVEDGERLLSARVALAAGDKQARVIKLTSSVTSSDLRSSGLLPLPPGTETLLLRTDAGGQTMCQFVATTSQPTQLHDFWRGNGWEIVTHPVLSGPQICLCQRGEEIIQVVLGDEQLGNKITIMLMRVSPP